MRIRKIIVLLIFGMIVIPAATKAQANELAQLALNIEKLRQFKSILSDLKKGYEIISKGYGVVKDLSKGNFSLHKTFLDGLMEVSPAVRKYHKIGRIIERQIKLVSISKDAFRRFQASSLMHPDELAYLHDVYGRLLNTSLKNLDELGTVLTSGKLRMSDNERLEAIDRLYDSVEDQFDFLKGFNAQTSILIGQRMKEMNDVKGMKSIYGIKSVR